VSGLGSAQGVSAGQWHTCTWQSDGTGWCWGKNVSGQLGDGSTLDRHVPASVQGIADVTQMSAGSSHSCAVRSDGTAWCWGGNDHGELGNGEVLDSITPVQVVDAPVQ
jgi:alpha-tubulin suppressor-like RCC1 family protein